MTPPGFGKDLCPVHRVDALPVEEVVAQRRIEALDAAVLARWRPCGPRPRRSRHQRRLSEQGWQLRPLLTRCGRDGSRSVTRRGRRSSGGPRGLRDPSTSGRQRVLPLRQCVGLSTSGRLQRWRASDPQPEVKRIHDSLRRGSQATALARPTSSRKVAGDPGG